MSAITSSPYSTFEIAVADGLNACEKHIASGFLYDNIGEQLFSAVAKLPEYGIAGAESRVLNRHCTDLTQFTGSHTRAVQLGAVQTEANCYPGCLLPRIVPTLAGRSEEWIAEARRVASERASGTPLLFQLPGGMLGNLDRSCRTTFLRRLRALMRPGDFLLVSADLVKRIDEMLAAYDDDGGIFAAFNKNLLARINRELGGHFNLRQFSHQARWNAFQRQIELYLVAQRDNQVYISNLMSRFGFSRDETIRTATAYKFSELELDELARCTGFEAVKTWIDLEWPFAETLWSVKA